MYRAMFEVEKTRHNTKNAFDQFLPPVTVDGMMLDVNTRMHKVSMMKGNELSWDLQKEDKEKKRSQFPTGGISD